jgi:hypothetical protein
MDVKCVDLNLTDLVPLVSNPAPPASTFISIDVSFQTGAGDLNRGYMNSTSWVPLNGSNIAKQVVSTNGNYTVAGVDASDFTVSSQLVYSLPVIQTVEYVRFLQTL